MYGQPDTPRTAVANKMAEGKLATAEEMALLREAVGSGGRDSSRAGVEETASARRGAPRGYHETSMAAMSAACASAPPAPAKPTPPPPPPALAAPPPPGGAEPSRSEVSAWCRDKWGKDWLRASDDIKDARKQVAVGELTGRPVDEATRSLANTNSKEALKSIAPPAGWKPPPQRLPRSRPWSPRHPRPSLPSRTRAP